MSRPQKVSDRDVYAAVHRAMARVAPHELTLAVIAAEAGVTSSALVQRFGSKRTLLLQVAASAADSTHGEIARICQGHPSPVAALRAYARHMGGLATTPAALARNLAYLQTDIGDEAFRAMLRHQGEATRAALEAVIRDAVRAGEIVASAPIPQLVRSVEHALSGGLLTWAVYQEGSAGQWLEDAVDAVLLPYRSPRETAS